MPIFVISSGNYFIWHLRSALSEIASTLAISNTAEGFSGPQNLATGQVMVQFRFKGMARVVEFITESDGFQLTVWVICHGFAPAPDSRGAAGSSIP